MGLQVSVFSFFFAGSQAASQRVSECCSVIRFHPVLTSSKSQWSLKDSRLVSVLLEGLELPTWATREGKQTTVDREGDEIQDKRRNGLAGRRGEEGAGGCSLQVDTPQVSR